MATSKTPENGSKKPAAKKATATKASASKTTAKKTASKTTSSSKKSSASTIVTSESRLQMIETAAYFIAEKNGFSGPSTDHWLAAEKQVDSQLNA